METNERTCTRCKKKFSRLHEAKEFPGVYWNEIHEIGGQEVCRDCDPGIPCAYIRGTGMYQ